MAFYINQTAFINAGDIAVANEITANQGTFTNLAAGNIVLAGNQTAPEYTATVSMTTPIIKSSNDMFIQTNGTTRLTIQDTGIALDNTSTKVLALSDIGTDIVYKTDIIDLDTAQVLTNKTLNSASNTLQVNGTNINSLVNQDVRTTSTPSFTAMSVIGDIGAGSASIAGVIGASQINSTGTISSLGLATFNSVSAGSVGSTGDVSAATVVTTPAINSNSSLTLRTNAVDRIVIPLAGTDLDNTSTTILGLSPGDGKTLVRNTNLVSLNGNQFLTNKTLETAVNTINIGGTNINTIISQPVLTISSPTFNNLFIYGRGEFSDVLKPLNIDSYDVLSPQPLTFKTAGTTRMIIPNAGIPLDNTITNVLGLQGTTLSYTTGLITAASATVFTNKTLNSASNTIQLNGTNINSLINQDVRTTANPTFNKISLTGQDFYYANSGGNNFTVLPSAVTTTINCFTGNIDQQGGVTQVPATGIFTIANAGLYSITVKGILQWANPNGQREGFYNWSSGQPTTEMFREAGVDFGINASTCDGHEVRKVPAGTTFYVSMTQFSGQNRRVPPQDIPGAQISICIVRLF